MLKYRLNTNKISTGIEEITPISVTVNDYGFDDHLVVSIKHNVNNMFKTGQTVSFEHVVYIDSAAKKNGITTRIYDEYEIQDYDNESNTLEISIPKRYDIETDTITFDINDTENKTLLLRFKNYHYFSSGEECNITLNFNFNNNEYEKTIKCDFVDEKTLKWVFDVNDKNQALVLNHLFGNCVYYQVGANENIVEYKLLNALPEPVLFTDPVYVKIIQNVSSNNSGIMYRKSIGEIGKEGEKFYRENFLFTDRDKVSIVENTFSLKVNIPLLQNFDTRTNRDDLLNERFTLDTTNKILIKDKSIEKDIYHPALIDEQGNARLANRIKFNLHFRKRDLTDGWSTPSETSFWNGTNDIFVSYPQISNSAFFDYQNNRMSPFVSNRSDLLSKIGFTDNDVKYQKNRLKKSFLRISYFSSTNPATQQLLGYSTIFYDTGKLRSKYIKYSNSSNYYKPLPDNQLQQANVFTGNGISVETEPYDISGITDDNAFEELRLSTQFVVSDRFFHSSSSEGFYVYLYKDYGSEIPKDLYMRVEFNHAGYGKKVQFFMPSYINSVDQRTGIKTYQQILKDWEGDGSGYGLAFYNTFSYIHLKYRYDFSSKKHIYYIDDEYYGTDVLFNGNNEITINLYEAKVKL